MTNRNEKPRIGEDGYYYFTYNLGAKYAVKTGTGISIYEIVECIYNDEMQSYCLHVYSEAFDLYREMSIRRLNYILSSADELSELDEGQPEELPVTKAEVELYYSRIVKARNKRKREANAKLKDDKEYQKLVSEEKEISPRWAQAICRESADEKEIEEKMQEIACKKREIIDKLEIRLADLKAPETCEICEDKGMTKKGKICECALKRSDAIKAYCSAERLVEIRKEKLLNVQNESKENKNT